MQLRILSYIFRGWEILGQQEHLSAHSEIQIVNTEMSFTYNKSHNHRER